MLPTILKFLFGIVTGKAGEQIGGAVSNVAQIVSVLGALGAAALWLDSRKTEVFTTVCGIGVNYGQLALACIALVIVLRLVHRADPPACLGAILNGRSAPGLNLLKALGLKRVMAYEVVP
jgi:hypothetical protein